MPDRSAPDTPSRRHARGNIKTGLRHAATILGSLSTSRWWQRIRRRLRRPGGGRAGASQAPWRRSLNRWLRRFTDTASGRLAIAVAIAAALHALVIFGVGFATPPHHPAMSLAVTLVHSPAPAPPRHARRFGAHNQLAAQGGKPARPPNARTAPSDTQADATRGRFPVLPRHNAVAGITGHSRRPQPQPPQPRAHQAARKKLVAGYLAKWRAQVEQVGNQHFPSRALAEAGHHQLTISVTVDAAGQVVSSRVVKSSGSSTLDRAALHILRMAAPFPPFSQALKKRHQTLRFAYTWRFTTQDTAAVTPGG